MRVPKTVFVTLFVLIGSGLLTGCALFRDERNVPLKTGPLLIEYATAPYCIAPLDKFAFTVRGQTMELTVDQEGMINLPGGPKKVVGLSKEQAVALVKAAYPAAQGITVTEFRPNRFTVLGEVFHQIHAQLDEGPMRVMDAIAAANGFTPIANRRRVKLLRQNAGVTEVYELDLREMMNGVNLTQNILIKPGDVITVPRNFL